MSLGATSAPQGSPHPAQGPGPHTHLHGHQPLSQLPMVGDGRSGCQGVSQPSENTRAAPAPASSTSLGTGACQAQAGMDGLKFSLGLKATIYSRGCMVLQSWMWGQGTCGVPATGAPTGHGPLVWCASFSMCQHRQPEITLFLKKPLNRAGMTQPFLGSLHRRHVWEEKAVVRWLLSIQKANFLIQETAPCQNCSTQEGTNYSHPPSWIQSVLQLHVSPYSVF